MQELMELDQVTIQHNHKLAETIMRNLQEAQARVLKQAEGKKYGDSNLMAMVAFEAMRAAQEERHNLRSMQAWLSVRVAKNKMFLDFPPTHKYPQGFGNLKEWLKATGVGESTMYELDGLATVAAPLLEQHGIAIENYLNSDRYPKFAEAIPTLRRLAKGEEEEHTLEEVIQDVETATSRDDMRSKYREERYIADGAVNKVNNALSTMTILAAPESIGSLLKSLQGKVEWHLSCTAEEQTHEVLVRVPKKENKE